MARAPSVARGEPSTARRRRQEVGCTCANWADLSRDLPFLRDVANSVGISVVDTLVATLVCAMGGYALAEFSFVGCAAIFTLTLVSLTIPFEAGIIPQYILIARD